MTQGQTNALTNFFNWLLTEIHYHTLLLCCRTIAKCNEKVFFLGLALGVWWRLGQTFFNGKHFKIFYPGFILRFFQDYHKNGRRFYLCEPEWSYWQEQKFFYQVNLARCSSGGTADMSVDRKMPVRGSPYSCSDNNLYSSIFF